MSQEQYSKWSWYLQVFFFFIFLKFLFLGCEGVKVQKIAQMKNHNYIHHVPYLKNNIAYNHDFWYTSVKWWYLQDFFSL